MEMAYMSINRGMDKKMWSMYMMEHYSAIKKEQDWFLCRGVDGPRNYHTEGNKLEKQVLYINAYMWNLKKLV